jgi:hypothetical protein
MTSGPSHAGDFPGMDRCMTLNASEHEAFTWTSALELGHILVMKDRCSDSVGTSVRGMWRGQRECPGDKGYECNLMGVDQGKMGRHILSTASRKISLGSTGSLTTNRFATGLNSHCLTEIPDVPTNNKLAAVHRPMIGWISDDVAATGRICTSKTNPAESKAICPGVE